MLVLSGLEMLIEQMAAVLEERRPEVITVLVLSGLEMLIEQMAAVQLDQRHTACHWVAGWSKTATVHSATAAVVKPAIE